MDPLCPVTFFYPSTEWELDQPFECCCKTAVSHKHSDRYLARLHGQVVFRTHSRRKVSQPRGINAQGVRESVDSGASAGERVRGRSGEIIVVP